MSCLKITWDDISFPPVNLWVVTDVSYFYRKAGEDMSITARDLISELVHQEDLDGKVYVRIKGKGRAVFKEVDGIAMASLSHSPKRGVRSITLEMEGDDE